MNKSWKTTLAGLSGFFAALGIALRDHYDGNPATIPNWDMVILAGSSFLVGLFARDNDKSSEQVGAKSQSNAPLAVIAVLCALTFSGCADANQTAESRLQTVYGLTPMQVKVGTNTVTAMVTNSITVTDEKKVTGSVQALGDAKQAIQSMNAKNTKATQAIGIAGVEQESSLEGIKEILKMIFEAGKDAGKASATGGVVR